MKTMISFLISIAVGVIAILGVLLFKLISKARKSEHFDKDNKHIKG